MSAKKFWRNYEEVAHSYEELHEIISRISYAAKEANRKIAWRGQADANWPLTSKLYREFTKSNPKRVTENEFSKLEQRILIELRQWGLHSQRLGGRLSVLSQLAMLQHFGAPTRLIDITFNALVAAFFATNSKGKHDNIDSRIFAIDITDRLLSENKEFRSWEDSLDTPWSDSFKRSSLLSRNPKIADSDVDLADHLRSWDQEWSSHYYAWKPPALDARIAAQNGGFLLGGIVGAVLREGYIDQSKEKRSGGFQIADPEPHVTGRKWMSIEEVRDITCLAIRPQKIPQGALRANTTSAVYSIRISRDAKKEIRDNLETIYGYNHSTIYPDFPGFAEFSASNP